MATAMGFVIHRFRFPYYCCDAWILFVMWQKSKVNTTHPVSNEDLQHSFKPNSYEYTIPCPPGIQGYYICRLHMIPYEWQNLSFDQNVLDRNMDGLCSIKPPLIQLLEKVDFGPSPKNYSTTTASFLFDLKALDNERTIVKWWRQ